jgi:hypothetical protein
MANYFSEYFKFPSAMQWAIQHFLILVSMYCHCFIYLRYCDRCVVTCVFLWLMKLDFFSCGYLPCVQSLWYSCFYFYSFSKWITYLPLNFESAPLHILDSSYFSIIVYNYFFLICSLSAHPFNQIFCTAKFYFYFDDV